MIYHEKVLHERWLGIIPGDLQFEAYQKADSQIHEIRSKVESLNNIERQLRLDFKLIDPKIPNWELTFQRIMHW